MIFLIVGLPAFKAQGSNVPYQILRGKGHYNQVSSDRERPVPSRVFLAGSLHFTRPRVEVRSNHHTSIAVPSF